MRVRAGPREGAQRQPGFGARPFAGVGVGACEHLSRVRTETRTLLEVVAQTLAVLDDRAAPATGALLGLELVLEEMASGRRQDCS